MDLFETPDDALMLSAQLETTVPDTVTASARDFDIGTNLGWYPATTGDSDPLIFIDQIKAATPWMVIGGGVEFDEDGYATGLPNGTFLTSIILNRSADVDGIDPLTGTFRLYGQGEGQIRLTQSSHDGDVLEPVWASQLPTEEINGETFWYVDIDYDSSDPDETGLKLKIIFLDETDYIRNLSLVHHSHLDEFAAGDTYAPEYLEDLASYDTLRFMEWMNAVKYEDDGSSDAAIAPEQRYIDADHFTYNTLAGTGAAENVFVSSVPIEHIVELANILEANAWISLPVDITDARAMDIAAEVAATLDSDLTVYWEYGNELWNNADGFEGYKYSEYSGNQLFGLSGNEAVVEWAAYRGAQLYEMIDQAFAAETAGARYVAPLWAFDAPQIDDWVNVDSYSRMYFAAAAGQALEDAPLAPGEIVTDYAIGMYTGANDDTVATWISETYATASERAAALARWALFGADDDLSVEVTRDALSTPETVTYTEGMSIGLYELIRADTWNGVDPLRDLDQILRIVGTELQYKGRAAEDWTTVLIFETAPTKSLDDMILDTELVGYGQKVYGVWVTGMLSSVKNQAWIRLDGHKDFVDELGLDWVAYEGAAVSSQVDAAAALAYRSEGWATMVLDVWFDKMEAAGVDAYMHYTSHARVAHDDHWGTLEYTGQPLDEAPVAQYLKDTIAAQSTSDQVLSDEVANFSSSAWDGGNDWGLSGTGSATTGESFSDVLTNTLRAPVTAGTAYALSFDISGSATDLGDLEVLVRARRGGMTALAEWSGAVQDGDTIMLDLGTVPDPHEVLEIVIWRSAGGGRP